MVVNVTSQFVEHALIDPDRVALRSGRGVETSYGQLLEGARRWVGLLPAGRRVAMWPRSRPDSVAAVLGTWMAGSSVVLMHRHLTEAHAADVLARARPAVVIDGHMQVSECDDPVSVLPFNELFVGLTSGSTGAPKPFSRTHQSWLATFARSDLLVQLEHDDVVAACGAIDHTHFLYALLHALAHGTTVDLRTVDNVAWSEATVMYSVPTIAADLVQRGKHLPRIRVVLSSGAAWLPSARRQLLELLPTAARVNDFYGTGEVSFVSVSDGSGPDGSVGRPFPGVSVRTVADDGTPTAAGEDGLIEVTSDMLFSGYLDAGGEAAPIDPWVTAGDHGHLDDHGFLFIAGRRSRMFTRGGLNVEPEAVERVLSEHPGVTAAACVPRKSTRWGSVPVAFVSTSLDVTSRELDQWCAERLDSLHRPVHIETLSALPVTHRGKLNHEALERLAAEPNQ